MTTNDQLCRPTIIYSTEKSNQHEQCSVNGVHGIPNITFLMFLAELYYPCC